MPALQEARQPTYNSRVRSDRISLNFGFFVTIGGSFDSVRPFASEWMDCAQDDSVGLVIFHDSCGHLLRWLTAGDFLGQDQLAGFHADFRQVVEE